MLASSGYVPHHSVTSQIFNTKVIRLPLLLAYYHYRISAESKQLKPTLTVMWMNEFTVFLPTLIMIIQFISHTHNELFNSENILLQTTKNVFIRCVFSDEFEGWLCQIADILWVTYKLFSVSVAELGRVFWGVLT